jgi:hypothetical protein
MRKLARVRSFFIFALILMAVIAVLRLMNWAPSAFDEGVMRKYGSIEEVKARLKLRDIYVPSYYPECLRWPPVLIAAQTRPFTAVLMEFRKKEKDDMCLIITQTALPHSLAHDKIKMARVRETVHYAFKGRKAMLTVGTCNDDEPCSRISWEERGYRISLSMNSTPIELIRLAESMVY